ncbi:MAG: molybdate ABC transporter substrate-binding protein, partial [Spirochaetaceae bacterium]|nr:molybdate ABC transporter substrate-binding protein [Spirochaetaceae bacterium]
MKRGVLFALVSAALLLSGAVPAVHAGGKKEATPNPPVTIVLAAAASLEKTFEEGLIPRFRADYPWVSVQGVYDSSGRLQTQIEQGLEADIFMSAATRQMEALTEQGLVAADTVVPLLQNRLVLIKPAGTSTAVTGFGNITLARIIALGDPATTPAGQYAREAFINLGNWDAVSAKLSLGNNVTEVLNWVAGAGA